MQETYKYSILEKKHVTLQMGSSTAMKRKENFNQGSSRVDMLLLKMFQYSGTSKQTDLQRVQKEPGIFSRSITNLLRKWKKKNHFCICNKTHDAGDKSGENVLSKSFLQ